MLVLGYALAALIGLSLGMLGGGGSILTVPVFVYVLGYDPKLAIAMSLPVVGATSLVGAVSHWKAGNADIKVAALFGVIAMGAAFVGARLAVFLSGKLQLAVLAMVMLVAALLMFRNASGQRGKPAPSHDLAQPMSLGLLVPVALAVGLLTGLIGIGGGFLVVPALVLLARVPMKQAVGTSLLVIALNSVSGFAGYVGRVVFPWEFLSGFTAVAAGGILAGTYLSRFVSQAALKQAFSVFLLLMGAFILFKNRSVFN